MLSLVGLLFFIIFFVIYRIEKTKERDERSLTSGTIVSHSFHTTRSRGSEITHIKPVIGYRVGNQSYKVEEYPIRGISKFPVGMPVDVYYEQDHPENAHTNLVSDIKYLPYPIKMLLCVLYIILCFVFIFNFYNDPFPLSDSDSNQPKTPQRQAVWVIDSSDQGDLFNYTAARDSSIIISSYLGSSANVTIPAAMDGRRVSGIGTGAFRQCFSLNSVVIPESVTTISTSAFSGCIRLSSVTCSEGLKTIQPLAFTACPALKDITLPSSLTSISNSAFPDDCTATFHVTKDSEDEKYCMREGFRYVYH